MRVISLLRAGLRYASSARRGPASLFVARQQKLSTEPSPLAKGDKVEDIQKKSATTAAIADDNPELPGLLSFHEGKTLKERVESLPSQIVLPGSEENQTIPLIRGIITDQFNLDLMVFGELENKANTENLIDFSREIRLSCYSLIDPKSYSSAVALTCKNDSLIPLDSREFFKNVEYLGLFGLCVPTDYGGLQLGPIGVASALEAAGTENLCLATSLAIHNLFVCRAIAAFGTDAQKALYLPLLAKGKLLGSLCRPSQQPSLLSQEQYHQSGSASVPLKVDDNRALLKAEPRHLSSDVRSSNLPGQYCGDFWWLAEHCFQSQPERLLLCTGDWPMFTDYLMKHERPSLRMSASGSLLDSSATPFIVPADDMDKCFNIVEQELHGLKDLHKMRVYMDYAFDLSALPSCNNLECFNRELSDCVLAEEAFLLLSALVGRLRTFLDRLVAMCTSRDIFNRKLKAFSAVQACIFEAQARMYALQSMVFFLAGIAERQTVSVQFESQLAFCYAHSLVDDMLSQLSAVAGADLRFSEHSGISDQARCCLEQMKRETLVFRFLLGSRALLINNLQTQVKQMLQARRPAMDILSINKSSKREVLFGYARKKRLTQLQSLADQAHTVHVDSLRRKVGFAYRLFEQVHPSLIRASLLTERAALFLSTASRYAGAEGPQLLVKGARSRSGKDELDRHRWISYGPVLEAAFNVLVMCSVLSRASRSRSIGLRHCDEEVLMATLVCEALSSQINDLLMPCFACTETYIVRPEPFNVHRRQIYPQHPLDSS